MHLYQRLTYTIIIIILLFKFDTFQVQSLKRTKNFEIHSDDLIDRAGEYMLPSFHEEPIVFRVVTPNNKFMVKLEVLSESNEKIRMRNNAALDSSLVKIGLTKFEDDNTVCNNDNSVSNYFMGKAPFYEVHVYQMPKNTRIRVQFIRSYFECGENLPNNLIDAPSVRVNVTNSRDCNVFLPGELVVAVAVYDNADIGEQLHQVWFTQANHVNKIKHSLGPYNLGYGFQSQRTFLVFCRVGVLAFDFPINTIVEMQLFSPTVEESADIVRNQHRCTQPLIVGKMRNRSRKHFSDYRHDD
ncbi:hypothetical protein WR25_03196 isoform D [Diploscapter pachys]|uniref:Uncharacterized protein n=1 Tax=Diploscapter pachys TaxID=2018661 RepID=A0A2A2KYX4_9BILA|nr:hypothetical protein WR25_03196 isoform D [Diploscapter pachys]